MKKVLVILLVLFLSIIIYVYNDFNKNEKTSLKEIKVELKEWIGEWWNK